MQTKRIMFGGMQILAAVVAGAALGGWQLQASTLGAGTTPNGSAFVNACAGVGVYSAINPGYAWNSGATGGGTTCNYSSGTSVTQSATGSGSQAGDPISYSNSATGSAAVGTLHLNATNSGDSSYDFPDGVVDAGWNDLVTVNGPGMTGQQAVWIFPIVVNGSFTANGKNDASAAGFVDVWQNGDCNAHRRPGHHRRHRLHHSEHYP